MDGPSEGLLGALRAYYAHIHAAVMQATSADTDPIVIARLGDDLDEFVSLTSQHLNVFGEEESHILQTSLATMQHDLRLRYEQLVDESHAGRPSVVQLEHTGRRGRPSLRIDPEFLQFAYQHRTTTGIANFLGVGVSTVRTNLLNYGIASPGRNPFPAQTASQETEPDITQDDDIFDPQPPMNPESESIPREPPQTSGTISDIDDSALDDLIIRLRVHYRRAGVTMLHGMLRRLGHHIPRDRIASSLLRIDPVRRVFERIRIRRRVYSVPGPNSLWHHDGQHGLIRWGIVIHGFIDGYSRLITGLRASNNNRADTVLDVFLRAIEQYGVPSRVRGDHGTENLAVAEWMEVNRGVRRGSYIWGRSVHNVRIERLWVDITVQIGSTWSNIFIILELHHGLDINNPNHIWLLHHLFLPAINSALSFFAESWNLHRIQIRGGPNRSPADMFAFDMLVHGVRGVGVLEDTMSNEELEVYGIDWDALRQDDLRASAENNAHQIHEETTSWIGQVGPPARLNSVNLDSPDSPLHDDDISYLDGLLQELRSVSDDGSVIELWNAALIQARILQPNLF